MSDKIQPKRRFKLIYGGLWRQITMGSLQIVAAPEHNPPFEIQAIALEEDTYLVLSSPKGPEMEDTIHPIRLMTQLIETRPYKIGTVLVQTDHPMRFLTVVHNVDQDPIWHPDWVALGLTELFKTTEQHQVKSLALPLLGMGHGHLKLKDFIPLLKNALNNAAFRHLKQLWIMADVTINETIIDGLA